MVIKSKTVRSKRGIRNCIEYVLDQEKGAETFFLTKYIRGEKSAENVIEQFIKGEERRKHKRKNVTTLKHEILSWSEPEITTSQMKQIANYYLKERAPQARAVVCLHTSTNKPHLHLIISGVTTDGSKSIRISKERFAEIKKLVQQKELALGITHSQVRHGLNKEANVKKNCNQSILKI